MLPGILEDTTMDEMGDLLERILVTANGKET